MDKAKLLKRAEEHIFSTGMDDATSLIAKANMKYGLAKMHYVQRKFGLEDNAVFVGSPDETITRNIGRWIRGISYGGKITWGNGREKLVMLDVKPNACGIAVGSLDKLPDIGNVLKNIETLKKKENYINDIKIKWDLKGGNHYIDICRVECLSKLKFPKYAVILHAGCSELKGKNQWGPGLYHDEEGAALQAMMKEIKTPFGPAAVLEGNSVQEYMKFHGMAVEFSKKRREMFLKEIFGIRKFITNQPHQFLVNKNQIALGCHDAKPGEIYPVSLRGDEPSFIAKAKKSFTMKHIEELGFRERGEELGVMKRLANANVVPHGGGYQLSGLLSVKKVHEISGKRFFELNMEHGGQKEVLEDARALSFSYRGLEVFEKAKRLELCSPAAKLIPVYVLKV